MSEQNFECDCCGKPLSECENRRQVERKDHINDRVEKIVKLIGRVKKEHLCSVEFSEEFTKIKKQLGNKTGSQIEIEFNNFKRIENIKFIKGGYNEPKTLKKEFDILLDMIFEA